MNLKEMMEDLDEITEDDTLSQSFKAWINDAILAVAAEFDLPALRLLVPAQLEVDGTDWIWPLPDDFHKKLFRCTYVDGSTTQKVAVHDRRDDLEYRDHSIVGPRINSVATATQGLAHYLLIDPLPPAAVTLNLWYYRKPAVLEDPESVCDCIPPEFHSKVIMPKVMVRNYQKLLDQVVTSDLKGISYWEGEYTKGLYGAPGQGPGMIRFLAGTEKPPRRTGGRDPVGWRPFR